MREWMRLSNPAPRTVQIKITYTVCTTESYKPAREGRIQAFVSGKGLLKRIAMTMALTTGLFLFLAAMNVDAGATPIRPNIRKLISAMDGIEAQAQPARAGWNGPEMPRKDLAQVSPALDPAVRLRANKAAILAAVVPDYRAVLAVIVVIFLMRLLRRIQAEQKRKIATIAAVDIQREQERVAA